MNDNLPVENNADDLPHLLQIAGFWRRIAADLIDLVILGIVFFLVTLLFRSMFYRLGPYGRLIGAVIAVGYFTHFTSRAGRGQTPGKWILKIAVTDAEGNPLPLPRALLRSMAVFAILVLNRWELPVFITSPLAGIVVNTVAFGGILSLLYGYIFNHPTGQGLHDLLAGSYVVRFPTPNVRYAVPTPSRWQGTIMGGLFGLGALISAIGYATLNDPAAVDLYRALAEDDRFLALQVTGGYDDDTLYIEAWYGEDCDEAECDALVWDIAHTTLTEYADIDDVEELEIIVFRAIDFGFTSSTETLRGLSAPVDVWRDDLATDFFELGNTFFEYDNTPAAIDAYTEALDIAPTLAEAYANRGLAYAASGDDQQALADLRQYRDMIGDAELSPDISALIAELEARTDETP